MITPQKVRTRARPLLGKVKCFTVKEGALPSAPTSPAPRSPAGGLVLLSLWREETCLVVAVTFSVAPTLASSSPPVLSGRKTHFMMKNGLSEYFIFCGEYCAKFKLLWAKR